MMAVVGVGVTCVRDLLFRTLCCVLMHKSSCVKGIVVRFPVNSEAILSQGPLFSATCISMSLILLQTAQESFHFRFVSGLAQFLLFLHIAEHVMISPWLLLLQHLGPEGKHSDSQQGEQRREEMG